MNTIPWTNDKLNALVNRSSADQLYNKKIKAYVFELCKTTVSLFTPDERERFNAEYQAFVNLEGDILEGQLQPSQAGEPSIYGFWLWSKSYDQMHFISARRIFLDNIVKEYKNSSGVTGVDQYDPQTGAYKFVQTREFFYDIADDQVYELAMQKYVFQTSSIEPPKPRFTNETQEYQAYINSETASNANKNSIKFPTPYNRFAYYKIMSYADTSRFNRLKLEFATGSVVKPGPFPDVIDDAMYDSWVLTIIVAGYDTDEQKRSILNAEYKPRFELEFAGWQKYLNEKITPQITNRYAFYKHLELTDKLAFNGYVAALKRRSEELNIVANICPGETIASGLVFQGSLWAMGVPFSGQDSAIWALTHTVKQMALQDGMPSNALQASDITMIRASVDTATNIAKSAGFQFALFELAKYYLKRVKPSNGELVKTLIGCIAGQSVLELRQLILDIKAQQPKYKENKPDAPSQTDMVIASILFGNPLAPIPDWMKSAADSTDTAIKDTFGGIKWVTDNLELIGIVAGSILIIGFIALIYSLIKGNKTTVVLADIPRWAEGPNA
jgi:hypothetical protein